jgi:hypothetical protein
MRDLSRIPILLSLIGEYWQRPGYSDQRLTQLLMNITRLPYDSQFYNCEDDRLIEIFEEILNNDSA